MKVHTKNIVRASFLLAVILAGGVSMPSQPAHAAETKQTLSVSPAIFEHVADPGSISRHKVLVINTSQTPLSIRASARSFSPHEEILSQYSYIYDASRWFKIDQPDFLLLPDQRKEVSFTLTVPPKAEPGGHYATLFFEPLVPAGISKEDKLSIAPRVGVLAFLVVKGDIQEKLSIARFSVPTVLQSGPVTMTLSLKNEGNVHLLPSGKVRIFDVKGTQIDEVPLKPGMVLPKTKRDFTFTWDKQAYVGEYSARAEITYGSPQKKLTSSRINFKIVPWLKAVIILVVIVPTTLLVLKTRGRWRLAWHALRDKEGGANKKSIDM